MSNELVSAVVSQMQNISAEIPIGNFTDFGSLGEFNPLQQMIQPVIENISPLLLKISLIVGGIFGIYLIYVLIMLYYEKKRVKILKNILFDLDQINEHYGLKTSKDNLNGIQRFLKKIFLRKKAEEELKTRKKEKKYT